ncbi:MAG: hypothetical protein JXD22_04635 [Sedimentisphaerales bacterium]|nr:hypothetical protein [Sedimentisphaerales bacterium]
MIKKGCIFVLVLMSSVYGQEQNLPGNPGFEAIDKDGFVSGWTGAKDVYRRDTAVARSGKASLKYSNSDPKRYVNCVQDIPFQVGRLYEFEVWVKTQGVKGSDTGATICVQWWDSAGGYIGGSFPMGVKGDSDWTKVRGVTQRLPENTARCEVECYLRKGMTGTAWFDDVSFRLVREDPLKTFLKKPNYRGEFYSGSQAEIGVGVRINLVDYELLPSQVVLHWKLLTGTDGKRIAAGDKKVLGGTQTDLTISAENILPGQYDIKIELLKRETGELLSCKRHSIRCLNRQEKRPAYIDEHNRLIYQGKPFYPLGMYWGSVNAKYLDVYTQSAFNCLMPYSSPNREQMDMCDERGLKVIYSVKDSYFGTRACVSQIKSRADELVFVQQKVDAFKDHPALLAWYINDELGVEMLDRLTERQEQMKALDSGHPTWVVLYQVDQVGNYISTFDVIGTDPYPIPEKPPSMAGQWTRKTRTEVQSTRPMWQVPQAFDWSNYRTDEEDKQKFRPPTREEMRSMAWQCIAEGANGLVFYSWHDLHRRKDPDTFAQRWSEIKTVAQEIAEMIPVLLSVEQQPAIKVAQESVPAWLNWTVRQTGESTYLIVVNNTRESHELAFELPREPRLVQLCGSRSKDIAKSRILPVQMEPLEVRIYEMKGLMR